MPRRRGQRAEVNKARAVLAMIDTWPIPDALDLDHPAAEKPMDIGGARVGEFVTLEVAAVLGISDPAASALVDDVAGLRSRHPLMWAAVQELRLEVWQARRVVRTCRELSVEAVLAVDRKLASGWGVLPWSKISKKLPGLIATADTVLAREKAKAAQDERYVSIRHNGDSTSWLIARLDTGAALNLQASLGRLTDHLIAEGAAEPLPLLRAQALEMLATPYLPEGQDTTSSQDGQGSGESQDDDREEGGNGAGSARVGGFSGANPSPQLPLADVVVHIQAEDLDPNTQAGKLAHVAARGGDVGPVLLPDITRLLGHFRVRVIPVIDQNGDPAVDAYQIPDRMRMALQLREETSVFPYSSRRSWSCDLDHTEPFRFGTPGSPRPPGQTRVSNLGPLSRREHRAKTAAVWKVKQPAQGLYVWTSPTGQRFAVVNGHTHRLPDVQNSDRMETAA
ncbi:MAG: 13E12 repeat family protein [Acidipropionibacterium sp.]|nr:13E12 repeat family protein [Acidipropionibacterium sp.]